MNACFSAGAEAPAQGTRRKPQADSSLASLGLQSGEAIRNRLLFVFSSGN